MNAPMEVVPPRATREAVADARVRAALACIEDAQGLIDRAGQALCSVEGMRPEWNRMGRVYEQVKRSWYAVANKADRLRGKRRLKLDHEPTEHEAEWLQIRWR